MTHKIIFSILLLNFFSVTLFSQNLVFGNIKSAKAACQCVIKKGEDIKGYSFIYVKDSLDNYTNIYEFNIADEKLNIIKKTDITVDKESAILEAYSNGSEIVLLIFSEDKRTLEYQVFDLNAEKKFSYLKKLSRKESIPYKEILLKEVFQNELQNFYKVDSIGYISNTIRAENKILSVSIDFYGTKENKQWSYVPVIGASYFFGEYLGIYKNVVYIYLYSFQASIYSENPEVFLVGLDLKTGRELFKKPADAKNRILAKGIKILKDGEPYLYGSYYKPNADLIKDKPLGFALWKIKEDGNIIDEKYISWENGFDEYLDISAKGKIQGVGYIYFHNLVQTSNGDIYIFGEGYDKRLNAATIISVSILGFSISGKGFTKQISTDVLLIKLDSTYKIKNITIYDKKNSNSFGYNTTQSNNASAAYSFWYFSNHAHMLNSISISDDKIADNKIKLNINTSETTVLPASQGKILLLEYFRTEKKMELHFEKFK